MFRCCECGLEYNNKPDFCECGNDVFEEIKKSSPKNKSNTQKIKKSFAEQYPGLAAFKDSLDPISVVIFCFCIVLSIFALIFIKADENNIANSNDAPIVQKRKVAQIDSFWDDTPPVEIAKKQNNIIQEQNIIEQLSDFIPKTEEKSKVINTPKVNAPPKTANKSVNKVQTVQVKKTPIQNVKPKATQPQIKQVQPKTQTVQKTANANVSKAPSMQPVNSTQIQSVKPQQAQPSQTSSQNSSKTAINQQPQYQQPQSTVAADIQIKAAQELKTFKNGLRNTLFSKINFTKVYGNGSCIVTFKVNSSGKLVERSFSKQSTNNTLNDEVYSAVINTPVYKVPPSSYNGQTLHFSVKFNNGRYEVSLY